VQISNSFNRFYHRAVLTELFKKCGTLRFYFWIDTETGGTLEFIKGEHFNDMDELKQILKNMNLDYAVSEESKISTSEIDPKSLIQHIEWVIKLAADNNISFQFVEDEWNILLTSCGIR